MTRSPIFAWMLFLAALCSWGGFYYMVQLLAADRLAYADSLILFEQEISRGETAARLRATIQSTEVERAALESFAEHTILQVVETIEAAGKDAGATKVSIGGATPIAGAPKGFMAYSISVSAQGTFTALMRTLALLETLPMPASVEQFDINKAEKAWNLNVKLRVIIIAPK